MLNVLACCSTTISLWPPEKVKKYKKCTIRQAYVKIKLHFGLFWNVSCAGSGQTWSNWTKIRTVIIQHDSWYISVSVDLIHLCVNAIEQHQTSNWHRGLIFGLFLSLSLCLVRSVRPICELFLNEHLRNGENPDSDKTMKAEESHFCLHIWSRWDSIKYGSQDFQADGAICLNVVRLNLS